MANQTAQNLKILHGVCVWDKATKETTESLLARLPTVEIWGIGPKISKKLNEALFR